MFEGRLPQQPVRLRQRPRGDPVPVLPRRRACCTSASSCGATPTAPSRRTAGDPMTSASRTTDTAVAAASAARRRLRRLSLTPHRRATRVLLVVAVAILFPLLYAVLGGFKTKRPAGGRSRVDPARRSGSSRTTPTCCSAIRAHVLAAGRSTASSSRPSRSLLVVALASAAAFVFAREQFRGREALYLLFVFGLLFPSAVAILPLYILVRQLGLSSKLLGVALPQAAFALPLTIVILRPFFRSIPVGARGRRPDRRLQHVRLLLAGPAAAGPAGARDRSASWPSSRRWNAFLLPLVILTGSANMDAAARRDELLDASTAPTRRAMLAYTVAGDHPGDHLLRRSPSGSIVSGLTSGSVKG